MRKPFAIGLSSWAFPWACGVAGYEQPESPLTPLALLEEASRLGVQVVQLADNMPLCGLDAGALAALRAYARAHAITIEVGVCGLRADTLQGGLALCESLGATLLRTLPHRGADVPTLEEAAGRVLAVTNTLQAAGVTLAIESHGLYSAAWLRALVKRVAHPRVGVCLDAANNLAQGESFREVLEQLGARTVNFHCKDFQIRRKPHMLGFDVEGVPCGEGLLDLPLAHKTFAEGLSWVIEMWTPWQGTLAATLRTERQWVAQSVHVLEALRMGVD